MSIEHCVMIYVSFVCNYMLEGGLCEKRFTSNNAFELRACTVPVLIFLMWRSLQ